jgi:single-stranded-DNA-specific exonuclease
MFVARRARLLAPPRVMKDRHLRLELAQEPSRSTVSPLGQNSADAGTGRAIRAVGWGLAAHAAQLGLAQGSLIDLAYRIRENDHPEYGGLEVEIAGFELSEP